MLPPKKVHSPETQFESSLDSHHLSTYKASTPHMDANIAQQISDLIKNQNQLTVPYTAKKVLAMAENYLYTLGTDSNVLGVVELRKVQWYQWEIDHLSVHPVAQRKGIGLSLLAQAEDRAVTLGARIVQCTIRVGNRASEGHFRKRGFIPTVNFLNKKSGNNATFTRSH